MGKIAAADAVELEVMRKGDSSWHPCQVSLSSDTWTGTVLIVDYGREESKDIIFTHEEALERLRVRSTPLRGDDCCYVREGEHVLACRNTESRILYFDAMVEKVFHVRHSKRTNCRCTFEIKWSPPDLNGGNLTIPTRSIMKLAIEKIDTHPVVNEFLNSVETSNSPGVSPFEDTVFETNFATVLEKQIEEISKCADVTVKGCSEDVLLEVKRDLTGKVQHEMVASQLSFSYDQAPLLQNNSRTTTQRHALQTEATVENPAPSQPILKEPFQTHLSPLGARAALASLMYKLPTKEDLTNACQSPCEKRANLIPLDLITPKFMDSEVCTQQKVSMKGDLFSIEGACPPLDVLKHSKTKRLHSSDRSDNSNEYLQTRASSRTQNALGKLMALPNDTEDLGSSAIASETSLTCSVPDRELNHPMKRTRLTRSAYWKGKEHSTNKVELKSMHNAMKLVSSTDTRVNNKVLAVGSSAITCNPSLTCSESGLNHPVINTRLTRSTIQKGIAHPIHKVGVESSHDETTVMGLTCKSSNEKLVLESSVVTSETKLICSVPEQPMKTTRLTRLARLTSPTTHKGIEHSTDQVEQNTSNEKTMISSSTRTTRNCGQDIGSSVVTFKTSSISDPQLNHSVRTTRLTHLARAGLTSLAIQEGIGLPNEKYEQNPSHDKMRLTSSTGTTSDYKQDMDSSAITFKTSSTRRVSDPEFNSLTKTTRLTLSETPKGPGHSSDEAEHNSSHKTKLMSPKCIARLTRSAVQKGIGHSTNGAEHESSHNKTKL